MTSVFEDFVTGEFAKLQQSILAEYRKERCRLTKHILGQESSSQATASSQDAPPQSSVSIPMIGISSRESHESPPSYRHVNTNQSHASSGTRGSTEGHDMEVCAEASRRQSSVDSDPNTGVERTKSSFKKRLNAALGSLAAQNEDDESDTKSVKSSPSARRGSSEANLEPPPPRRSQCRARTVPAA